MNKVNNSKIDTPYCLWEFFPYATNSEKEWYDEIKVSIKIKKYLNFKKILPSQIWLLSILTYTMKKAIFSGKEMYLFLTKNKENFKQNFFDNYLELLNIQNQDNIIILVKKDNQNRNFHFYNIKNYFKNGKEISFESVEQFFKEIWGIPSFKMKRKRKRAKCKKVIRKRVNKSRKV